MLHGEKCLPGVGVVLPRGPARHSKARRLGATQDVSMLYECLAWIIIEAGSRFGRNFSLIVHLMACPTPVGMGQSESRRPWCNLGSSIQPLKRIRTNCRSIDTVEAGDVGRQVGSRSGLVAVGPRSGHYYVSGNCRSH